MKITEVTEKSLTTGEPFARHAWEKTGAYVVLMSGGVLIAWADCFGPVPDCNAPWQPCDTFITSAEDLVADDWYLMTGKKDQGRKAA